jgi:hypothetical protein
MRNRDRRRSGAALRPKALHGSSKSASVDSSGGGTTENAGAGDGETVPGRQADLLPLVQPVFETLGLPRSRRARHTRVSSVSCAM